MELILFTKIFERSTPEEVGETAKRLGVDGLDLAVRQRQCVEPATVAEQLPAAVKYWREIGLTVPMVTLEGGHTDPDSEEIKAIYRACAESGVANAKLSYWSWRPGDDYWAGVNRIRRALEGFEQLSREYGVRSLVHTHSGNLYGSNVASAMMLVKDCDPDYVGVYLDPAHQAFQGEGAALALGIAGRHLKMVGVKDAKHSYVEDANGSHWVQDWVPLGEGIVDWPEYLGLLKQQGYGGPLSVHATYSDHRDKAGALRLVERDLAVLRRYLSKL